MTDSQDSLPFVLLAGVPENEISKLKNSIDVTEFEVISVPDVHVLLEKVPDPRCFLVVFCDSLYRDALGIMNEGYSLGSAKWILYSKLQSTEFRAKAENAGAALVFEYPVNGAKIALRAKQYFSKDREKIYQQMNRAPASRPVQRPQTVVPIDAASDFRLRRKWPDLRNSDPKKSQLTFDERIQAFNNLLVRALEDLNGGGALTLLSFGVDAPVDDSIPEYCVILASTNNASEKKEVLACALHPEIRIAYTQSSAIAVNDVKEAKEFDDVIGEFNRSGIQSVAAIPIYSQGRIYAMINAQFGESMSDYVKSFLSDLTAYSVELDSEIQELDFFSRVYRTMPKAS